MPEFVPAPITPTSSRIVDPFEHTLTVLAIDGGEYVPDIVVPAGKEWRTDHPFPLTLDPAEFC